MPKSAKISPARHAPYLRLPTPENDVDIKYIQSLLGYSSIMTMQIYTNVNPKKQKQFLAEKRLRINFTMAMQSP